MSNIADLGQLHDCTGCGMCAAVCPVDAIQIRLTEDGFYMPKVDTEKCINCSKCVKTCYKFDASYHAHVEEDSDIPCYSAKNKNPEELKISSSGAVSIELMRECLKRGYYVAGVAYDYEQERAVTKIAKRPEELRQFQGSKYFQSYTEQAFREIVQDKSSQKYAIFGTPCQIYAFSKYAERTHQEDRFFLVDIFCHGCPSFLVWKKYLAAKKEQLKTDNFDEIRFRSKSHGWHEFCFDFIYGTQHHVTSKISDPFYELFFSNDTLNKSCYDCVARSSVEKADLRLGDFWGARCDMDTEGISAVAICSERGESVFSSIKQQFKCNKIQFNEVIKAQSYGTTYAVSTAVREQALEILQEDVSLKRVIIRHRKLVPFKLRVKALIKLILRVLPQKQYMKIRKMFH